MMRLTTRTAVVGLLLLSLVGWGTAVLAALRPAHARHSHRVPAAEPRLTAVDAAALRQKLSALKGKVVVLNMWATWCGPCVMEFPELVKLDRAYRGQGVTVVGLSVDNPQGARQAVSTFITRQKASFPIYILKSADAQPVVEVFDKHWEGAIPMTYVFDRSGHLQTRLTGARSLESFEMAVKPVLARP